jgi:hypothetical protein
VQTDFVFSVHVSALLDKVRHQLEHAVLSRMNQRMFGSVLAQRCLDLLVLGVVEGVSAVLKRAGLSVDAGRLHTFRCTQATHARTRDVQVGGRMCQRLTDLRLTASFAS